MARALRKEMTPAEQTLWSELRGNQLHGAKFRRQQVIAGYIADFYCHAARLVIELDGPVHQHQTNMTPNGTKPSVGLVFVSCASPTTTY
jgi:very-short-patch-repair endonuclease